jgi:outer membrane protein OmpA-like peptidoglycan-associated protein
MNASGYLSRASLVVAAAAVATGLLAPARAGAAAPKRTTLAITYPEGASTELDMIGVAATRGRVGEADVKRKDGRTRVKLEMKKLPHPQSLGTFYTTYLLWAVAPEGRSEPLAELPHSKGIDVDVTTAFQTFGLIVTAEPHSAVRLPSPLLMAENSARDDTRGLLHTSRLEYGDGLSDLYAAATAPSLLRKDRDTPLLVLGARNAVEIARQADAARYADAELREAEAKLQALEQSWGGKRKLAKQQQGNAREVMRVAEHARLLAVGRAEQAGLAAERERERDRLERARSAAERAQLEAEQAKLRAEMEGKQAAIARSDALLERERARDARDEAERAKLAEGAARSEADRARANEESARAEAERARREAEDARREHEQAQLELQERLSEILETRRETRGIIVSLSDVLFDFNRATLTPGAREKLSKLAGILIAYPGSYRISTEGHTDSVGTEEYNQRLSEDRAGSVLGYLVQAGIPSARTSSAVGFGESRPVASNDSSAGRQMNRRVEIVISDLE